MSQLTKKLWGVLALRGIVAILFGLAVVFWPGLTLVTLVYLFSALLLIGGVVGLVVGVINISKNNVSMLARALALVLGIAEIGVGIYLLKHVGVTLENFVLLAGLILIARGVVDGFSGLFEEDATTNRTILTATGALSVIIGVIILMQPAASGIAFVWILGLYALIVGPMLLALSYDLKN